jgi:bacteriocin-like protein
LSEEKKTESAEEELDTKELDSISGGTMAAPKPPQPGTAPSKLYDMIDPVGR